MHEQQALALCVDAAVAVAKKTAATPTEAAMQVACAYLVAREQLQQSEPIEPSDAVDAMMKSAGFKPTDFETTRVMQALGLKPLLQFRKSKARADFERLGWFRRWLLKMIGA